MIGEEPLGHSARQPCSVEDPNFTLLYGPCVTPLLPLTEWMFVLWFLCIRRMDGEVDVLVVWRIWAAEIYTWYSLSRYLLIGGGCYK